MEANNPGVISGHIQLSPGQRRLFRVTRTPGVFQILAWLDCSVPGTRGHLTRLLWPRVDTRAQPWRRPPGPPPAGVREPLRPRSPLGGASMAIDADTDEAH
jgi:hypothetical protein